MKVKQLISKMQCSSDCEIILIPDEAPNQVMDHHFLENPDEYSEGDATIATFQIIDHQLRIYCY